MIVLSFLWSACSTAAVMVDGVVAACTSEERFSRIKNDERFPGRAIHAVLHEAGVKPEDIDCIALPGLTWSPRYQISRRYSVRGQENRLREQQEYWYPIIYRGKNPDYYEVFHDFLDLDQYPGNWERHIEADRELSGDAHDRYFQDFRTRVTCKFLGIDPDPSIVTFVHHHRCHAAYAYYSSPFVPEPALVLTADAWGDDMNAGVYAARNGQIKLISKSQNLLVARLYRSMTLLLGMKPDEHEYKVMGLAPYGKEAYYLPTLEVFRNTQYVDGLGFAFKEKPQDLYVHFRDRLEGVRFDNIAGALQHYTEEILTHWTRNSIKSTSLSTVSFGGGLGMNVKAMLKLAELPQVDKLYVPPTPSDESLVMGAAYAVTDDYAKLNGSTELRSHPLDNAYLGPDLEKTEVASTVDRARSQGFRVMELSDNEPIVDRLVNGKIIGRCVGRSEFGARALGNRSINADPRSADVIGRINRTIKSRDFWMPFAPSILASRAAEYLVNPKQLDGPYMTVAFNSTDLAWEHLRAGLHPADRTCRPQILSESVNRDYHGMIEAFFRRTGVGGVLNTSFNVHGEPIIQTASEALRILEETDLDAVQLPGVLIEKD